MTTWLRLAATGLLGASLAMACTITTSDDLDDDDDEDAGRAGRAGSSSQAGSGGAGRAGAGGSTGGSSAGRAGAAGASAGTGVGGMQGGSGGSDIPEDLSCDDPEGTVSAPSCEFDDPLPADEPCLSCLSANCCDELRDCYATEPSDLCGWGTAPDGQEEYKCYMDCLVEIARASDTKSYTSDDQTECSLNCGTRVDGMGESCSFPIIGTRTSVLMGCMHDNCEDICMVDRIDAP